MNPHMDEIADIINEMCGDSGYVKVHSENDGDEVRLWCNLNTYSEDELIGTGMSIDFAIRNLAEQWLERKGDVRP